MTEFVLINDASLDKPMYPQGVVLLDPVTGSAFNPDACSHVYGYTAGNLTTDTATDGTSTRP